MADHGLIQGRWVVLTHEENGVRMHGADIPGERFITFSGRQYAWEGNAAYGTFVFDETTRPKQVEYLDHTPGAPSTPYPGIYKLTDDRYRNCFRAAPPRPERFGTRPGDGTICITYRRATEEEQPPRRVGRSRSGDDDDGW